MTGSRTGKTQQTKLDKFTRPKDPATSSSPHPACPQEESDRQAPRDPSLSDIMTAIRGIQGALQGKMDSMSSEITLLTADFRKMGDRVKENQGSIELLQSENRALRKQVQELQKSSYNAMSKLDDLEGRSRRNNIRIMGVPEKQRVRL